MFAVCKTEAIIPEESLGHSSMQQRQTPCAHYLSITDQLLWSHSSRLQIRPVLVAYSSTSSRWEVPTGPWAISPSGQSVKFTPQQVIVVDSGRQVLLWGKNSFWKTSWNSASPAATRWRPFLKKKKRKSYLRCQILLFAGVALITVRYKKCFWTRISHFSSYILDPLKKVWLCCWLSCTQIHRKGKHMVFCELVRITLTSSKIPLFPGLKNWRIYTYWTDPCSHSWVNVGCWCERTF